MKIFEKLPQYRNSHFEFVMDVLTLFRIILYKTQISGQLLYLNLLIIYCSQTILLLLLPVRFVTVRRRWWRGWYHVTGDVTVLESSYSWIGRYQVWYRYCHRYRLSSAHLWEQHFTISSRREERWDEEWSNTVTITLTSTVVINTLIGILSEPF